ncbi:MAG: pyridoxal phosphate-dependent aminotransferase [Candidatus Marinimicrobia bacterium]|nr:pyridoxal phosphate-dependent aminotransferase [Candidatus Neomarinimicrobiota bacterium]
MKQLPEQILENDKIFQEAIEKNMSKDTINFAISEPYFPVPAVIRNTAQDIILSGKLNNTSTKGLEKLRVLIAEKFNHSFGSEGVSITVGASEALYSIVTSLIETDDEVLIPALRNKNYDAVILLSGGKIRNYKINNKDEKQFTISNIEEKITEKTKMIILNNPLNPTGQIIYFEQMTELAKLCEEKNIYLVVDESYNEIHFANKKYPTLSGFNEFVIVFTNLSKLFDMSGWRLGWILSSEKIIEKINIIRKYSVTCAPMISQQLAINILGGIGDKPSEKILTILSNRRKLMSETLKKYNLESFIVPAGGYYLFFKYSEYLDKPLSSIKFSKMLKKGSDVLTVPGTVFGKSGEGFIRISFAVDETNIQEGVKKIKEFIDDLNNFKISY